MDAVPHSQPALNQFSPAASIGCDDGPGRVVVPFQQPVLLSDRTPPPPPPPHVPLQDGLPLTPCQPDLGSATGSTETQMHAPPCRRAHALHINQTLGCALSFSAVPACTLLTWLPSHERQLLSERWTEASTARWDSNTHC